jgi:glycerol-3-phosphate dehydrogenase
VASPAALDCQVAVIGGGVVGSAVARDLARRGASTTLLEAESQLASAASGSNSGILHTGFDSPPGELETDLILRAAQLRETVLPQLGVPVIRCGAELAPAGADETKTIAALAARAGQNGVEARLRDDGVLEVPGESVTDPVAFTRALARSATDAGAEVRTGVRVDAISTRQDGLELSLAGGERVLCRIAVNCAGLHGDRVARLVGDDSFEIYPRKGEFFVFEPPPGHGLERILLPVPSKRTKGVLVFPTADGKVVAGPTAHDQRDKDDWSVRPQAYGEVMPKATAMLPALAAMEPISSRGCLRPAGRDVNYLIGPSTACPDLVNVAAIRSTGLSASLAIGEHVGSLVEERIR